MSHIITLKDITKKYGSKTVLNKVSLAVGKNEFCTLLGPSGCGKTTTLRLIAGFEHPENGEILFCGKKINGVPPYKRKLNTVFQKYALFPHMNVFDNIAFGLKIKKVDKKTITQKVSKMLELVALSGFEKRNPESLSGGEQQRVAIARALVNEPEVLLLDEPLGALDLKLRRSMQEELKKIQRHVGITFIYVTHDQEEALTMSDSIVVLNEGTIQQAGTPEEIYNRPQNTFVADFIGQSNIINGVMLTEKSIEICGNAFDCISSGFSKGESVFAVIRPEDVKVVPQGEGIIDGVVKRTVFKGVHYEMSIEAGGFSWLAQSTRMQKEGSLAGIHVFPENIRVVAG